ncbi:ribonuclease HI [Desulfatibacillum aliphaticivorans]|uniref:ribonuclease HI n=1 Tax=Desulfatibacillum aliphaticivorans TaxID=218208 RepID=UPI000400DF6B|nr:ribonuclease H [Desulfatibacillum aliphaticivorans]
MAETDGKWVRMALKNSKVWAESDGKGNFVVNNGKVKIKYKLDQEQEYTARVDNLAPVETLINKPKTAPKASASKKIPKYVAEETPDLPENAIIAYTDGASSHNPGPAGLGVLLKYKGHAKEISQYIGETTNNVAELSAILVALQNIKKRELPVRIFTDSKYSFGVLFQGWKAKANVELIAKIQNEISKFRDIKCYWVKGHANNPYNEIADKLATDAIKNHQNGTD